MVGHNISSTLLYAWLLETLEHKLPLLILLREVSLRAEIPQISTEPAAVFFNVVRCRIGAIASVADVATTVSRLICTCTCTCTYTCDQSAVLAG